MVWQQGNGNSELSEDPFHVLSPLKLRVASLQAGDGDVVIVVVAVLFWRHGGVGQLHLEVHYSVPPPPQLLPLRPGLQPAARDRSYTSSVHAYTLTLLHFDTLTPRQYTLTP